MMLIELTTGDFLLMEVHRICKEIEKELRVEDSVKIVCFTLDDTGYPEYRYEKVVTPKEWAGECYALQSTGMICSRAELDEAYTSFFKRWSEIQSRHAKMRKFT